jgi:hypothetical protein
MIGKNNLLLASLLPIEDKFKCKVKVKKMMVTLTYSCDIPFASIALNGYANV